MQTQHTHEDMLAHGILQFVMRDWRRYASAYCMHFMQVNNMCLHGSGWGVHGYKAGNLCLVV